MKEILFIFSNRKAYVDPAIMRSLNNFIMAHSEFLIETVITQHAQHLTMAVRKFAEKYPAAIIVIAGGDGSLNEAANTILSLPFKNNISLCPIPFGTSNDFCKLFYQNFNFDQFLNELPDFIIQKIDVLKLTGSMRLLGAGPDTVNLPHHDYIDEIYVLNVMSLGFDTAVLKSTFHLMSRYPFIGTASYYFAILKHFLKFKLKTIALNFELDEQKIQENCLLAAFCNGGFYGNGFNPAPDCDLADGYLNYCISPRFSHGKFLKVAVIYKKGKIKEIPQIKLGLAKRVNIFSKQPILANFDGILFEANELSIESVPDILPLVLVGDQAKNRFNP